MKKLGFFLMTLMLCLSVSAKEYEQNQLIPIDDVATVETEKFIYHDFSYANGVISFTSIENQTLSKTAVSVNLLLFDSNKKNIGFVTYCSDKDVSSDYAGTKLSASSSLPFAIDVSKRYFVEGKTQEDISYLAIMDENKYCQIGGYDKYQGLTISEIVNGGSSSKQESNGLEPILSIFEKVFTGMGLKILIGVILYFLYGIFLNLLHMRMYARKSIFCYLPILNFYISAKLTFGRIISKIYIVVLIALCVLGYFLNIQTLYIIAIILFLLTFFLNVLKLLTRNYSFLVLEPAMKNESFEHAFSAPSSDVDHSLESSFESEFVHTGSSSNEEELEEDSPISVGSGSSHMDDFEDVFQAEDDSDDIFEEEEEEGESDLSKLFK